MEKMLKAIHKQHPGCELRDFRLLANLLEVNDQDVDELDAGFADAIENAEEKTVAEIGV